MEQTSPLSSGSHWYSKSLGDGLWAAIPSAQIEEVFRPLYETAGRPADMAVFVRPDEGRLHCEMIAYFSPAAETVAIALDARPCAKLAREGLTLLAGNERCWSALFAD